MKILFVGDSITKGTLGTSFIKIIQYENPGYNIKNAGLNGDTFSHISERLLQELSKNPDYDGVVLQGGYNDLILPYFQQKGKLFQFALKEQLKKGLWPLTSALDFENAWRRTVQEVKRIFKGKLVLTTIGCINEDLHFTLNFQRAAYNTAIRKVAQEEATLLADSGLKYDQILSINSQTNYFLESFWAVTLTDPVVSHTKKGPDWLSRKRHLQLTIDGVHLNNAGARIFKVCIIEQLQKLKP
ncbi:hypothetical protein AHMF7605_28745 [Adhaeribacter arboris]|uniref:SGNH hydrolase-type esterase domain-containing protein n=1 Tax=Adhaeribacter arboris TaxID=2072846 RepID=A0A2T2Y8Q7_9BACT|nr:GDSL-type esterase/lipase family protein [Adhaeribacter arboris]PSR51900.1 hypothetical protein AHMF7605_28745 [Adhaeribacter arboris]